MTERFEPGLVPYTDAEREADQACRDDAVLRRPRGRRIIPSGQRYDQPPSPQTKARDLRIMGESP